jgi:cytidylate kinase
VTPEEPFEKLVGGSARMPIITIYQGASGSGQELAEAVAGVLGYRCVGRTELLEASRRYRIPEAKLNQIMEKGPHWWERLWQNLHPYRVALQAALCEIAADGKIVYHGHLGHELLPGISHVLKVLLTAPMDARIKEVQSRDNFSEGEARRYIDETDKARSRRLMSMFGADWRDPSRFDLVLNLGQMNVESAKGLIVAAAKLEEYQPSVFSESQFQDFSLTARVHAALLTSQEFPGSVFVVHAENGQVHISGNLQFWVSEEQVVRAVERVPGVTKVTTGLGDISLEDNVV